MAGCENAHIHKKLSNENKIEDTPVQNPSNVKEQGAHAGIIEAISRTAGVSC